MSDNIRFSHAIVKVMKMLLERPVNEPVWGYDISRRTGLRGGTVVAVLKRMTAIGWVVDCAEPKPLRGGPPRKLKVMTAYGRREAALVLADRKRRGLS